MRPDDAFWAARIVSRFTDEMIRGVVAKARYSDPKATEYIAATLIKRRDKVVESLHQQGYLRLSTLASMRTGRLRFANAAVEARAATPPVGYTLHWFAFDNATDTRRDIGDPVQVTSPEGRAPASS